jgi:hypothetical protein
MAAAPLSTVSTLTDPLVPDPFLSDTRKILPAAFTCRNPSLTPHPQTQVSLTHAKHSTLNTRAQLIQQHIEHLSPKHSAERGLLRHGA